MASMCTSTHTCTLALRMGYEKEIILTKNARSSNFTALHLLDVLKATDWKETLFVIDRGDDFDWINAKGEIAFREILTYKTVKKEYIGFTLQHQKNKRFVTVNMDEEMINFSLDIDRNEDELSWFKWYHEEIIRKLKDLVEVVEWRSNYDNEIIKLFKKEEL